MLPVQQRFDDCGAVRGLKGIEESRVDGRAQVAAQGEVGHVLVGHLPVILQPGVEIAA